MENLTFYFLGLVGASVLFWVGVFYFGDRTLYKQERELMDALRPARDPWDILAERCGYCGGKTSKMTDRCTHCGAPT